MVQLSATKINECTFSLSLRYWKNKGLKIMLVNELIKDGGSQ